MYSGGESMRWGFQTDGGAAVVQVRPFADGVFVLDEAAKDSR